MSLGINCFGLNLELHEQKLGSLQIEYNDTFIQLKNIHYKIEQLHELKIRHLARMYGLYPGAAYCLKSEDSGYIGLVTAVELNSNYPLFSDDVSKIIIIGNMDKLGPSDEDIECDVEEFYKYFDRYESPIGKCKYTDTTHHQAYTLFAQLNHQGMNKFSEKYFFKPETRIHSFESKQREGELISSFDKLLEDPDTLKYLQELVLL